MKRQMLLTATVAILGLGCGESIPDDQQADVAEDETKADAIYPAGRYEAAAPHVGDLAYVVLNADHTFERRYQMVDCIPIQSCGPEKGKYQFTHSGSTRYIRFNESDGTLINRFGWKLSGKTLSVRPEHTSRWEQLTQKANYAQLGESCGGFVVNPLACAPGLECVGSGLADIPGTCAAPSKSNPCETAGGSCVALAPGTCDGTIADARTHSCGGGLGVECCMPKAAPAPSSNDCVTARDCNGLLPDFCRICSNGSEDCAHWACESGKCTVSTCE